jgi:hypothetical protein
VSGYAGDLYVKVRPDPSGFASELRSSLNTNVPILSPQAAGRQRGLNTELNNYVGASRRAQAETAKHTRLMEGLGEKSGFAGLGIKSVGSAFTAAALGFTGFAVASVGVQALGHNLRAAVEGAGSLQKSGEAIDSLFGKAAPRLQQFAKAASTTALGISEQTSSRVSAEFGVLFKNLGIGEPAAANMTIGLQKLGGAIARIRGLSPDTILNLLPQVLAGNTRSLRGLGLVIDSHAVKEKALQLGFITTAHDAAATGEAEQKLAIARARESYELGKYGKGTTQVAQAQLSVERATKALTKAEAGQIQQLTPAQRARAIYAVAMEHFGVLETAAAKHSQDLVSQEQKLSAEWSNARDRLGKALLPALTTLVTTLASNLPRAINSTIKTFHAMKAILDPVVHALGGYKTVIEALLLLKVAYTINSWVAAKRADLAATEAESAAEIARTATITANTAATTANTAALIANRDVASSLIPIYSAEGGILATVETDAAAAGTAVETMGTKAAASAAGFDAIKIAAAGALSEVALLAGAVIVLGKLSPAAFGTVPGKQSTPLAQKFFAGYDPNASPGLVKSARLITKDGKIYVQAGRALIPYTGPLPNGEQVINGVTIGGGGHGGLGGGTKLTPRQREQIAAQAEGSIPLTQRQQINENINRAQYNYAINQSKANRDALIRAENQLISLDEDAMKTQERLLRQHYGSQQAHVAAIQQLRSEIEDARNEISSANESLVVGKTTDPNAARRAHARAVAAREEELRGNLAAAKLTEKNFRDDRKALIALRNFYKQEEHDTDLTTLQRASYRAKLFKTEKQLEDLGKTKGNPFYKAAQHEESELVDAVKAAELKGKNTEAEVIALKKLIAFYKKESDNVDLTVKERDQFRTKMYNAKLKLNKITGAGSATDFFKQVIEDFKQFGSTIGATTTGILSPQQARATFSGAALGRVHIGTPSTANQAQAAANAKAEATRNAQLEELRRHTALLRDIAHRTHHARFPATLDTATNNTRHLTLTTVVARELAGGW